MRKFLSDPSPTDGAINKSEKIDAVSKDPIELPAGFEWVTLDIN